QIELEAMVTSKTEELRHTLENLQQEIIERKRAEEALQERVKELNCLQALSLLIENEDNLDRIFQQWVDVMPDSWYYPEIACVRILFEGRQYQSENFRETDWRQSADLKVMDKAIGIIELYYLEERPLRDEGPFLMGERNLINLIGERLGNAIERLQGRDALRESEKKYQVLFENTGEALFVAQDGKVVFQNPRSLELTGYSTEEFQSREFIDFIHEDDREIVMDRHIRRLRGEKLPERYPFRIIHKNGDILLTELNAVLIQWNGKSAVLCFMTDITEQKRAEKALKSNYALLQIAGETAIFGGWSVDLENNICTWSDAVADIHDVPRGYSPPVQEAIKFYAPEWREKIIQIFSACAKEGISYDEEMEIITQKRKRVWVRTTGKAVKNVKGKVIKVQGSFQDITEQKQTVEALRKDRERMDQILRATQTNINTIDSEYNLRRVDGIWQKIYGDPQGQKCYKYFMDLDKPCKGCGVPKALATREIVVTEEFLPKENRHIEVHTIPFQDENGEWLVTEFNINITERKQAEAEKEKLQAQFNQAQKMESVGRLAGGVAHDFNNMLGVILGHTELALLKTDEDNDLVSDLNEIQKAAKRSVYTTKQLLAFARKQTISPRRLDLNDTVESMLNMLRKLIGEDIELVWKPYAHLWPVKVDPSQIDQR
ncbi:MAG: PAS domain S-box protein, partial [Desulfobacteraceae bacterium]|nr:PAS domain S-box protein [Desulfobacteraceae bacterium]